MDIPPPRETDGSPEYCEGRFAIHLDRLDEPPINTSWRVFRDDPDEVWLMFSDEINEETGESDNQYVFRRAELVRAFNDLVVSMEGEGALFYPYSTNPDYLCIDFLSATNPTTHYFVPQQELWEFLERAKRFVG